MYQALFVLVVFFIACMHATPIPGESRLQFNSNGKFKVVQFTDLHFGGSYKTDMHTLAVQGTILSKENPDLVVITGDLVSGYLWNKKDTNWFYNNWIQLIQPMVSRKIKWAIALGNHDREADLTGAQVIELDSSHELSLTQAGPATISGSGNYQLPIFKNASSDEVGHMLWMLDSGHNGCMGVPGWGCIETNQINWYKNESQFMATRQGSPVPGTAFFRILPFHFCLYNAENTLICIYIPLYEHLDLWNSLEVYGNLGEEVGVCCSAANTGMYTAMKEMNDIKHVFCGHDHSNDYYGNYFGINLGYGRKTGYGGYGPPSGWQHGARVIEISETGEVATWLRLEDKSTEVQARREGSVLHKQWIGCCDMAGHGTELTASTLYIYIFNVAGLVLVVIGLCVGKQVYHMYKRKEENEKDGLLLEAF